MNEIEKHRNAFTLIEILVTLTIISLLAALLLPALRNAREKGKETMCLNNLRQIGIAMELYTQDFGGYIPGIVKTTSNYASIYVELDKYLSNSDSFWCPSSGEERKWSGGQVGPRFWEGCSYGFNYLGDFAGGIYSGFCPIGDTQGSRNMKEIVAPEQMVVATEGAQDKSSEYFSNWNIWAWNIDGPGSLHHGGCNTLFADGHVSWHSNNYLRNTRRIWRYDNQ